MLIDAINATIDFRTSAFETEAVEPLIVKGTEIAVSIRVKETAI